MPGPKPTPTATLALRGSWRANTRPNEPTPEVVTELEAPASLTGRALELWETMAPRLQASQLLTVLDVPALARYVRLYAAWEAAMRAVEAKADRSTVLTLGKLDELLRKLESNLGLTPADRTGIAVPEKPAANDKGRFFKAG